MLLYLKPRWIWIWHDLGHFKPTISRCFPSAVVPSTAPLPTSFEASKAPAPLSAAARPLASDAEMPFAPQVSAQSAGSPVSPIRELPELKEAIMVQAKGWKIW